MSYYSYNTLGEDILDLRNVEELLDDEGEEGDDARLIRKVIEDETSLDFHDMAHNYEPTLIHEFYFEDYARQLAEDIGAIDRDATWPAYHIDWKAAAEDLKQDYVEYEIGAHTYYGRNF